MIKQYLGIDSDYVIIDLAVLLLILIIVMIINAVKMSKLKNRYEVFMKGKNAKSLEDTLIYRLEQIDELKESNAMNERNIETIFKKMNYSFQKYGLVKYDALEELGGKLSFVLAKKKKKNDGYVFNVVHSREGCYSYIKEIINGNAVISFSPEEEEALKKALEYVEQ